MWHFVLSCLHMYQFLSLEKDYCLWSGIIPSAVDKKQQVWNSMTSIILVLFFIWFSFLSLKVSFDKCTWWWKQTEFMKSFQVPVSVLYRHVWMQWFDTDISWKSKTHWRSRSVYFHSTKSHSWAISEQRSRVGLDLLL